MADLDRQPVVLEYLDYREFLRDHYEFKKRTSKGFSLRTFSDRIGFKTKDFILRVMQGQRNLSRQSARQVAKALRLGVLESDFFVALVDFNQATSAEEKEEAQQRIHLILRKNKFRQSQHILAWSQMEIYSGYHHLAIRSLIGLEGFHGDYKALGQRLHPPIGASEVKHSVELLCRCGLLQHDPESGYKLTHTAITTGDRITKSALRGFHQKCLQLGSDAIDSLPSSQRSISGLTLGLSQKAFHELSQRIDAFRKELALLAEEDEGADQVYQIELLAFPLTSAKMPDPAPKTVRASAAKL